MTPFLGQIQPFGFNFAPQGWAFCNGQLMSISQWSALFSLLGTIYGGDGRTTFALPDLRGRYMMHQGQGPGLSDRRIGARAGQEAVTLLVTQLPSHFHSVNAVNGTASFGGNAESGGAQGNDFSSSATNTDGADHQIAGTSTTPAHNTNPAGGSQSHDNMSPYLVINVCIAMQGIYPSRN